MLRLPRALLLTPLLAVGCADHSGSRGAPPVSSTGFVAFESHAEIPAGVASVSDSAMADLTGDGRLDLAVIDRAGAVRVLVGTGNGVFSGGATVSVAAEGSAIRAADADNDGDLDLFIGSFRFDVVTVLANNGVGDFSLLADVATAPVPTSLAVQDCNDDGIEDILVTHFAPSFVEVFVGHGDGTFAAGMDLPVPLAGRSSGLTVADVNGDGTADILLADTDHDQLVIYRGDSEGLHDDIVTVPTGAGPFGVAAGDLTGDGVAEIVVSNFDAQTLQVFAGATFALLQEVPVDGLPGLEEIGDVTGDGQPDVVLSMIDSRAVSVFEGQGAVSPAAPIASEVRLGTTGTPYRPMVGDVDGDGWQDLVVAGIGSDKLNLFLGRTGGLVGSRHHDVTVDRPAVLAAADFDGDGVEELVSGGLGAEQIVFVRGAADTRGAGDPALTTVLELTLDDSSGSARTVHEVSVADVDLDGWPDVLVAVDGGVKLCRNISGAVGPLAFEVIDGLFGAGAEPRVLAVADVTGDRLVDLVVGYDGDSQVSVAPGTGMAEVFGPAVTFPVSGGVGGLAAADFDGDGVAEVAISLLGSAMVQMFEANSDGRLTASTQFPLQAIPSRLGTADFNGDGRADLVVSTADQDAVNMLVSSVVGGFIRVPVDAGARPVVLLSEDLDGDGAADMLVASEQGEGFRLMLGDGAGSMVQSLTFPGAFTANAAAFVDLNGDGARDLAVGAFEAYRIAVFKGIGQ